MIQPENDKICGRLYDQTWRDGAILHKRRKIGLQILCEKLALKFEIGWKLLNGSTNQFRSSLEGIWQDFRPIKIRIDWIRLDLTPDWVKVSLYHPILTRIFITTCDFYSWFWIKVIRDTDNRVNLKLDLLMLYILPISLTNFQFTLRSDCWLDFLKFYPFKLMRDTQWTF